MRFCPFCAKETSDDAGRCVHCGKRLPARTSQHAPVGSVPPMALKSTMLGLGTAEKAATRPPEGDSHFGPTTIGGPDLLDADPKTAKELLGDSDPSDPSYPAGTSPLDEISADPTRVVAEHQISGRPTSGRGGPGHGEEDTQLPPPAPGMQTPKVPANPAPKAKGPEEDRFDPPTKPGIQNPRRISGPEARPQGQAPVARIDEPGRKERITPTAMSALPPSESTSPMVRIDKIAKAAEPVSDPLFRPTPTGESLPKSSSNIPALPPPPVLHNGQNQPPYVTSSLQIVAPPLQLVEVPPIPATPESGSLFAAVRYLWPVGSGILMRRREQTRIRKSLVAVQQSLDGILLKLGKVAFAEEADSPPLLEEMTLLRKARERRDQALAKHGQLSALRVGEEGRRGAQEADLRQVIAELNQRVDQMENELLQRTDQRRQQLAEVSRIDGDLARLARAAEDADRKAAKVLAQDPQAASSQRAKGDSARGQAEALSPQREQAIAQARALEEPIAQLTAQLGSLRSELGLHRQELTRQLDEKAKFLAAIDEDLRLCDKERTSAEGEMQQRMMTVGTLSNLYRSDGERYQPLYRQVDEIKGQLATYESTLARLETESLSYDRPAVQKGLLILGALLLLAGLVVAVLYLVWAIIARGH